MLCKPCLVRFRFWRRKTYPWIMLANAVGRVIVASGSQRDREKVRWMVALSRIDLASALGFINDWLLW